MGILISNPMAKDKYVVIGTFIALLILIIGFMGPWYTITGEFLGLEASVDIGLMGTSVNAGSGFGNLAADIGRNEADTTMYFVVITLVLAIISLVGFLGVQFQFGNISMMKKVGEYFGIITFVVAIIAIIYYVANLPDTSNIDEIVGINAGLGWGFFIFLIGAIIVFITNIMSRTVKS
jgi:hypothetical protein